MKRILTFLVLILQSVLFSQQNEIYNSYLAHISAANLSLKLNDAVEAAKWLQKAPASLRGWEWDMLNSLTDRSLKSFSVEEYDTPTKAAFSSDGRIIAIGTTNGNIYLLRTDTFEKIYTTHITNSKIYDIKFSTTGEEIFICSSDTTIVKFNLLQKNIVWSAFTETIGSANIDVNYDNNSVLFTSWVKKDNKDVGIISIYDPQKGRKIWGTEILENKVVSSRFRNDGKYFATGLSNGQIILWDFANKQRVRDFNFSESINNFLITDVDFSPNGLQLAAVSDNASGKIWDLQSGKVIKELIGHTKPITSVAFNYDGSKIFTGSSDASIFLWDLTSSKIISKYFGHKGKINSLIVSPADDFLISTSDDKSVKLWDSKIGSEFTDKSMLNEKNNFLALNKTAVIMATNGPKGSITIWDAKIGLAIKNFPAFDDKLLCADFSDSDTLIVGSYAKNIVRVWRIKTGEIYNDYMGMAEGAISCDFHPGGKMIAAASSEGAVFIWEISKNMPVAKLATGSIPNSVRFSPDGKLVAAACADGKIYVWAVGKFQKTLEISASTKPLTSIRFSLDSKKILATSEDFIARVFEIDKGRQVLELKGHSDKVLCGGFSADNSRIATGSADKTVKIWDAKTGECIITFSDFSSEINSLVFSSDNQRLYVNSNPDIKIYSQVKPK
ncbi:MAG: hypothetical protein Fur0015_11310 [Ignavibacteriales bacterium]